MIKQTQKKTVRDPILKNLAGLQETINKISTKNIKKMETINKNNHNYDFKLFNPSIPKYHNREQIGLAEQIMLRQIDKLMEDQEKLNIELNKLQIRQLQDEHNKQLQTQNNMDHYTFLRQYWQNRQTPVTADKHLEKLIHNVGSIKGHIKLMIMKENETVCHPQLHDLIMQSPEYKALFKKYINLSQNYDKKCSQANKNKLMTLEKSLKQSQRKIRELQNEKLWFKQQLKKSEQNHLKINAAKSPSKNKQLSGCKIVIHSATDSYHIQIKLKQIDENKQIFSSLSKEEVVSYFENSGRRGKIKNSHENADRVRNGQNSAAINYSVEDISKSKFISTKQIL